MQPSRPTGSPCHPPGHVFRLLDRKHTHVLSHTPFRRLVAWLTSSISRNCTCRGQPIDRVESAKQQTPSQTLCFRLAKLRVSNLSFSLHQESHDCRSRSKTLTHRPSLKHVCPSSQPAYLCASDIGLELALSRPSTASRACFLRVSAPHEVHHVERFHTTTSANRRPSDAPH